MGSVVGLSSARSVVPTPPPGCSLCWCRTGGPGASNADLGTQPRAQSRPVQAHFPPGPSCNRDGRGDPVTGRPASGQRDCPSPLLLVCRDSRSLPGPPSLCDTQRSQIKGPHSVLISPEEQERRCKGGKNRARIGDILRCSKCRLNASVVTLNVYGLDTSLKGHLNKFHLDNFVLLRRDMF